MIRKSKVLHIGEIGFPKSWDLWYQKIASQLNWEIERTHWAELKESFKELESFDFIRMDPQWAGEVYHLFQAAPPLMKQWNYTDFIFRKSKVLWPMALHKEVIHSIVVAKQPSLNLRSSGLIIGTSPRAMMAVYALVELGIKHITFVIDDPQRGQQVIEQFKQQLFEVDFEVLPKDQVILLSGIFSVVLIYEDLRDQPEFVTAVLYFNYLESGGVVINAGSPLEGISLVSEGVAIGAKIVDIKELQVFEEITAISKVYPLNQKDIESFFHWIQEN